MSWETQGATSKMDGTTSYNQVKHLYKFYSNVGVHVIYTQKTVMHCTVHNAYTEVVFFPIAA